MCNNIQAFLQLIKLGIGTASTASLPDKVDWSEIEDLAVKQGLSAVMVDGVEKLSGLQRPPQELLLQWIGESLQSYEYRFGLYKKAIAEMAAFYNCHGYKMMVLKGYACSLDWPKPEHRPCGDIDIWLFGKQKEGDELMTKEKGVEIDNDHKIHTVFSWGDFIVENHYEFFDHKRYRSLAKLEQVLEEMAKDCRFEKMEDAMTSSSTKVYIPSANFHALFLIIHALNHFASIGINLRQVLDWAFFMEKHSAEVDWKWLMPIIDKYHMRNFFNCINTICVEELGFCSSIFPSVQFLPHLKDKVFNDIVNPEFQHEPPKQMFTRLAFKYSRWKANEWKRKLCYNESRLSNLLSGVWAHLLKPKTI